MKSFRDGPRLLAGSASLAGHSAHIGCSGYVASRPADEAACISNWGFGHTDSMIM